MRIFKLLVLFCFFLCLFKAKCENDTVFYRNSILFPLSNFINSNEDFEKFKIGFLHNFHNKIALRLFLGFNLNHINTSKPINTESDKQEIKEYYLINSGVKICLTETKNLIFYSIFDAAFSYDLKKIEGFDFSSVTKTENIFKIYLGFNLGIEFLVLNNLSLSFESGISYHTRFGNNSVRIGNISQEDELPTETNFGIRPFFNYLNISFYF